MESKGTLTPHTLIPIASPNLLGNELAYVTQCIETNWISSQGKFVKDFEEKMAQYVGTRYAVATSSGTTALHLALTALGIGKGDEVIVPTLTFIATVNAVAYTGATPVLVDSEKESWQIDPEAIQRAITPRTKAIILVHLYGQPCKMDEIMQMAKAHNLRVIEDVAEAHGARYKGIRVGSIGDVGCFSFYANKIITCGEGGMVVTNHKEVYDRMTILRDHGMSKEKRYWHEQVGFNYRLTNIQAAIGCAQLERIEALLEARAFIQSWYEKYLSDDARFILPKEQTWSTRVCWLYTLLINTEMTAITRDQLIAALQQEHIDSRPMFYPIHTMPPYYQDKPYPVAQLLSRNGLSLPSFAGISQGEVERICRTVKKALG